MIITQTPLRISFVGGGTDLPSFYRLEGGAAFMFSTATSSNISRRPRPHC